MLKAMKKRHKATIVYATETGKSEKFANILNEIFLFAFDSRVVCMEDYDMEGLSREDCIMVVTSTFGNGEAPDNGRVLIWYLAFLCRLLRRWFDFFCLILHLIHFV